MHTRLKQLIKQSNKTQRQVAEAIGKTESNLSRILTGKRHLKTDLLQKICEVIEQPLSAVINDES